MDPSGNCPKPCRCLIEICTYMDIHGHPWTSMDIHGYPWTSIDIQGHPWISMDVLGPVCTLTWARLAFAPQLHGTSHLSNGLTASIRPAPSVGLPISWRPCLSQSSAVVELQKQAQLTNPTLRSRHWQKLYLKIKTLAKTSF